MIRFLLALSFMVGIAAADYLPVCTASTSQAEPAITFDGINYLVAWIDMRDYPTDSSTNVYACRLTPDGRVLDTVDIQLTHTIWRDENVPRVCRGDTACFVIWHEGC